MLVEREDGAFETVEPLRALLRRSLDDPQMPFLEVGFRAAGDANTINSL
jgi:hypothetical protein